MDLSQHGVLDLSDAGSFSHLFGVWLPKPVASLDSLPPPLGSVPSQAPGEGLPLPMEISVRASPEFLIHLAVSRFQYLGLIVSLTSNLTIATSSSEAS